MLLLLFFLLAAANCKAGRLFPADCLFSGVAWKYLLFGLKGLKKVWISTLDWNSENTNLLLTPQTDH